MLEVCSCCSWEDAATAAGLECASTEAKSEASEDADHVGVSGSAESLVGPVVTLNGSACMGCGSLRPSH